MSTAAAAATIPPPDLLLWLLWRARQTVLEVGTSRKFMHCDDTTRQGLSCRAGSNVVGVTGCEGCKAGGDGSGDNGGGAGSDSCNSQYSIWSSMSFSVQQKEVSLTHWQPLTKVNKLPILQLQTIGRSCGVKCSMQTPTLVT
jgi:hypothetical protein